MLDKWPASGIILKILPSILLQISLAIDTGVKLSSSPTRTSTGISNFGNIL